MKFTLILLALSLHLSTSAFAKITTAKDNYFLQTPQGDVPLISVNTMIEEKNISKIVLYGNSNLISFATKNGPVKLYSIDAKGFTYSIEPFTSYTVTNSFDDGKFQFKEIPNRKYFVDAKGFILY
jgi:hypothetical protein